jgi:hypothetical protein
VLSRAKDAGKEKALESAGKSLQEKLSAIEDKLVNPKIKASQDPLNFPPRLDHQFVGLTGVVASADAAPAPSAYEYFDQLRKQLAAVRTEISGVFDKDLADFNRAVREAGVPPIVVPKPKDEAAPPAAEKAGTIG